MCFGVLKNYHVHRNVFNKWCETKERWPNIVKIGVNKKGSTILLRWKYLFGYWIFEDIAPLCQWCWPMVDKLRMRHGHSARYVVRYVCVVSMMWWSVLRHGHLTSSGRTKDFNVIREEVLQCIFKMGFVKYLD